MTNVQASLLLERIKGKKVLVVGDVMIDQYLTGTVNRISPEAPVPILMHQNTRHLPGGAANVALNLSGMGAEVWLASAIGNDDMGKKLTELLLNNNIHTDLLLESELRMTTCKTRVMAGKQHLLRVDQERRDAIDDDLLRNLIQKITAILGHYKIDIVVMQDYNKGVLSTNSIRQLLELFNQWNIPVTVDPKFENFFTYRNVTLFKPNLAELRASLPFSVEPNLTSLKKASAYLRSKLDCDIIVITLSDKGIYIDRQDEHLLLPTQERLIADVCGAGDTVISVASLAVAEKFDLHTIAYWASYCGTLVCQYPGVMPISRDMLME